MKELKNGQHATIVFAFNEAEVPVEGQQTAISIFVHYEQLSIFSFYMEEDVDKIFLIDVKNFTEPSGISDHERKAWNLENILDAYQELVDMGINDNVLIKVLETRSRAWDYWTYYFDITDASEEDIAMILMRWKGIIYGRKEN